MPLDLGVLEEGKGELQGDYRTRVGNLNELHHHYKVQHQYKQLVFILDLNKCLLNRVRFILIFRLHAHLA